MLPLDPLEDVGGVEEIPVAPFQDDATDGVSRDPGGDQHLRKLRGGESREDVGPEVAEVARVIGRDAGRAEAGELPEDLPFVPRGGNDPEPCRQALDAGGQHVDDGRAPRMEERLVEGVDQNVADPLLGSGEGMERGKDPLGEGPSRVPLAPLVGESLPDGGDVELGGVPGDPAGQHGGQSHDEAGGPQALRLGGLTAVPRDDLASRIHVGELGDDGRLPGTGIPGDEQGPLARVEAPEIDLLEEPLPSGEVLPLGSEVV